MPASPAEWAVLQVVWYPVTFAIGAINARYGLGDSRLESGLLYMLLLGPPVSIVTGLNLLIDRRKRRPTSTERSDEASRFDEHADRAPVRVAPGGAEAGRFRWRRRLYALVGSGKSFVYLSILFFGVIGPPIGTYSALTGENPGQQLTGVGISVFALVLDWWLIRAADRELSRRSG